MNGKSHTEQLKDNEREIVIALLVSLPLIVLAVLSPALASYGYFKPAQELTAIWFQRSGALTVMLAVLMEYNLSKVNEHINLSGIITSQMNDLSEKYSLIYKFTQVVGVVLAIIGTVIWGYGDLLLVGTYKWL